MNDDFDITKLAQIEAADDTMTWIAKKLGMVVMQAKNSDNIVATWIFDREDKATGHFERQQITAIDKNRRFAIAKIIKGISSLADIDVAVKLLPYREQLELVKTQLGDNLIEEDENE